MQPARSQVRQVRCPECGAYPQHRCVGARDKLRESNHMERVLEWMELNAWKGETRAAVLSPPSAFGWTDAQYEAAMCALFNP